MKHHAPSLRRWDGRARSSYGVYIPHTHTRHALLRGKAETSIVVLWSMARKQLYRLRTLGRKCWFYAYCTTSITGAVPSGLLCGLGRFEGGMVVVVGRRDDCGGCGW